MSDSFENVFGNIEINRELKDIFSDVSIENIVFASKTGTMKVYIFYDKLIQKSYIQRIEKALADKLKNTGVINVVFYEKYKLGTAYSEKVWFDNYKDSIMVELENYDHVLYTMFKQSDFIFKDESTLSVIIPQNTIYHNRERELSEILRKISNDRFGYAMDYFFDYKEAVKSKYLLENERRAMRKLKEIQDDTVKEQTDSNIADEENTVEGNTPNKKLESGITKPSQNEKNGRFIRNSGTGIKKAVMKGDFNKLILSDNPEVIYKREFEGEPVPIEAVSDDIGEVVVHGKVLSVEEKFLQKSEKYLVTICISDFTDSIIIKLFFNEEMKNEFMEKINGVKFLSVKGSAEYDDFSREVLLTRIIGIKKAPDFRPKRSDNASIKRVELHCHTKMSDMDGVSDVTDIIAKAREFGHPAMAITDHGNVQAFPIGNHQIKKDDTFKLIYGVEGYLVNDEINMVYGDKDSDFDGSFVVFELKTTGYSKFGDEITEIGAVRIEKRRVVATYSSLVNPLRPIPLYMQKKTHIEDENVKDAPTIDKVLPDFLDFIGDSVLISHNAPFNVGFLESICKRYADEKSFCYIDTMALSRYLLTDIVKFSMESLCKKFKINTEEKYDALYIAEKNGELFIKLLSGLYERGIYTLAQLKDNGRLPDEAIAKLPYYHIIILAKNEVGRRNLYKLVSLSNVCYWHNRPKIPKSKLKEFREGLIIGSACERGEIYRAIVEKADEAQMAALVDFYDYLEIQPLGNNKYQIESDKFPDINSFDDIISINKKIVELGDAYGKLTCATCDVHFLNPEDEIYRRIIQYGKGMAEEQPPLYFRTTDEMLEEFEYLGSDRAFEVVVTNTNIIADKIERITPVRPDKAPPVIENSDETLRKICYDKAYSMYGDPLPDIVKDRLEKELKSIIGNGYAVMYIIAQKLVWKSVEDGYLVGSRGSVGSSFVATMAGITEVNPLSPHYYCKKCHYNDFFSEDVKKYAGAAGCDMPDKVCPNCGEMLLKDGFDIPFETFLGFKGDKEPDIDLNFSDEYQSKAHKYTEVIFGAGQTYRAGTIQGLADKTAYGYIKKYFDENNCPKREGEINRLVNECMGIRTTTGQHPGGIVVLPVGEDINSFTPLQKPANDMKTDIITTHFEYHSIDHNLLKLDILGHRDPTMIRCLQDLTGIDPVSIPLDDKEVMSLFQNLDALKITPEDIGGCELGSLGIPEFGTDFAMGMLKETKPQHFSDLVRIAGLSHGTDVWLGNAQTLLQEGKATISTAICTRDDIMTYLINMGVDPAESFSIMENVRKGKVAKGKCDKWQEWKKDMLAHNVPDWYVWSCERIQYMFPKAHAAAYVMMAWRIAYCKINYPLEYYCAFFSVRSKAFSYETMCMGRTRLEEELDTLKNLEKKGEKLSNVQKEAIKDLRICQEMYARGFSFWPIDLYKSKAKYFQVIDGKILPAFTAVAGLGENAAVMMEEAAKGGRFLSKDDIKQRAKIGQSTIDKLSELGILDGLPDTNQLSIFDLM